MPGGPGDASAAPLTDDFIHESRSDQSSITSIAFVAVAGFFVALRMFTRGVVVRNIGPEDWTILVAWVCSLGLTICILFEVKHGQGHHIQTLTLEDLTGLYKALYYSIILYQGALVLNKVSILCQYYRLFPGQKIRLAIWVMAAVTGIYGFWSVFGAVFMCKPIPYFWNRAIPGGHCIDSKAAWFANAGINIVTDFVIFLLPMPALKKLQLPKKQKIGLMLVFALGGFVCLTSILRLRALYDVTNSTDLTWENGPIAYWSSVEVNVGIVCASLPTLKAFAMKYFPSLVKSSKDATSTTRKSAVPKSGRTKNATFTEIELGNKAFDDTQALDPSRIQVVTVVEQNREDVSGSNSIHSQDKNTAGRPASRGPDMV
ncbi:hypothetical protein CAC42_796 [Sphaceloma murrayae]|uniref:Rhodopsin domain-containing protein n=1 Tax=Sphaceloma murrayae TaxID=2082308 RepID=A0A2K1QK97_9PEZI|nr:hypothetical protein CAC42_796 [Sphaceloma murrayae]